MQTVHVPAVGLRYWVVLSLASTFGANLGDFVSSYLHLGYAKGLLPLAALLGLILFIERRNRFQTEAFYWAAIIVIRTAATNLADLLNFDLRLGYPGVLASLTILMILVVWAGSRVSGQPADGQLRDMPATDGSYWIAMIVAGTLGTAIGDLSSFGLNLGTGLSSIVLAVPLAALLFARHRRYIAPTASYWLTVVAVRAAATAWGDHLAKSPTLKLGLPLATALSGTVCVLALVAWRGTPRTASRQPL
jgi:uncharacterized membrane-anchored protein